MVAAAEIVRVPLDCDLSAPYRGAFAVIGNIDGIHLGHQALVATAVAEAKEAGAKAGVIVFDPHPRQVFQPDAPPFLLTQLDEKAAILGALGVDTLFVLPFIDALYKLSPEAFVEEILAGRMGLGAIFAGEDFRFGAGRSGDAEGLCRIAVAHGLKAGTIPPIGIPGEEKYSSSSVRTALQQGDPQGAARILGRPWAITGTVIEGRKLARTLDFPTANVPLGDYLRPKYGVYAIKAMVDGRTYCGVANIGLRPTVDGETEMLEANLFDFSGDLYGTTLTVELHHFLRAEQKFDGLDALKAQIAKDATGAKGLLVD